MMISDSVIKDLKKLATKKKAKASAWFFKTGKGQYGYGDIFFGVTVPEQRRVAKKYEDLPLPEIQKLLKSKVHECRLTALLILVEQYKKTSQDEKNKIVKFYLKNTKGVNNWDLVDSSSPYILGDYLLKSYLEARLPSREVLYRLAKSKNLWERRIAIVSTIALIRVGQFEDTLKISEILLSDKHDLIHKAVGWMLREVGKKSQPTLEKFLKKNIKLLPRTTLRYATERFSEKKRRRYLKK
ncbi:MAG: DNA alkylation repair protein [Minisyncoccia bacterium]